MAEESAGKPRPKIIASDSVAWREANDVPRFGIRYRALTYALMGDDYHVGVSIEELAPGKQGYPFHYHIFEEEHVYVLDGEMSVRLGDDTFAMKAGDYVCFPAGQKIGHCLINTSDAVCRYVMIGERNDNEIAVYPDSNKVVVRALGGRALLDLAATRGYWHGEDTGLPEGVTPPRVGVIDPVDSAMKAKPPVSLHNVEWRQEGEGRFSGRSRHLTDAAVGPGYRVGVLIESPAPGTRLCPKHYHMLEEEHALILQGEATLLYGDERHVMKPGDYVCFPAGEKVGHSFLNSGSGPCSYLMIGEHNPADVCVYPDSNKVMVRALKSWADIFDMSATRRYWDGEEA